MRRLISIIVTYMLGKRYISYTITHWTLSAFPYGRTQHVRHTRSSIVSMCRKLCEVLFLFVAFVVVNVNFETFGKPEPLIDSDKRDSRTREWIEWDFGILRGREIFFGDQ